MALTLAQAAVLSTDNLQRGVIEVFVQESSVLDRLPLMDIEGNSYAYNKELALPGVAFRAVNGSYTESTGTFVQASETLSILGGDADVDTFIQKTRSNINDQRAQQTRAKVKAATFKFQDTFFNGDTGSDANAFDGLKTRLTGAQVIATDTNGMGPVAGGHDFFDALDELLAACPNADALYMNSSVRAKVMSSARRLGGADFLNEELTGKRVPTYNGIPLLDPGATAAGANIIPQDETQGSSSVASSIYAVRFGQDETDGAVTGLTNGGVSVRDMGEVDDKPALRTRIEFFCGLATFGGNGAARLTGVLNG